VKKKGACDEMSPRSKSTNRPSPSPKPQLLFGKAVAEVDNGRDREIEEVVDAEDEAM
jgi:hypothetical protein